MLEIEARQVVRDLADALLSVRPLVEPLASPVRVNGPAETGPVLDRLVDRLGAPRFALSPVGSRPELDAFARVASDRLDLPGRAPVLAALPEGARPEVDALADASLAEDFGSFCRSATVTSADGTRVRGYAAGRRDAPPVVVASACGMPARLAEKWVRYLARDHYVVTWESRGLFGVAAQPDGAGFDGATDVAAQAADLLATMDHFDVRSAHLAGLCGGAVLALVAARQHPERFGSLSLWHGDFDLGPGTPKTDHQRNLQALLAMASEARVGASGVHSVLCQAMLDRAPPDLAHLVLYPYATPQLLLRYCRLNGAIMGADVRAALAGIAQPTLVVTSADDTTAHPDSSRMVAERLPNARLVVLPHGDHISLFRAQPRLLATATGSEPPT